MIYTGYYIRALFFYEYRILYRELFCILLIPDIIQGIIFFMINIGYYIEHSFFMINTGHYIGIKFL